MPDLFSPPDNQQPSRGAESAPLRSRWRQKLSWAYDISANILALYGAAKLFHGRTKLMYLFVGLIVVGAVALGSLFAYFPTWTRRMREAIFPGVKESPRDTDIIGEEGAPGDTTMSIAVSPLPETVWWRDLLTEVALATPDRVNAMLTGNQAFLGETLARVNLRFVPLREELRLPFLLATMYFESEGKPEAVGSEGELGLWQIRKGFSRPWLKKMGATPAQLAESPALQAGLLNAYCSSPADLKANWRYAHSGLNVSILIKVIKRIFPNLPPDIDPYTLSAVWMTGPDPKSMYANPSRMLGMATRGTSTLLLAKRVSVTRLMISPAGRQLGDASHDELETAVREVMSDKSAVPDSATRSINPPSTPPSARSYDRGLW